MKRDVGLLPITFLHFVSRIFKRISAEYEG